MNYEISKQNYSSVDPTINAWIKRHNLKLYTAHLDIEVRSVDAYTTIKKNLIWKTTKKFQIWIDPPENNTVAVHVWDYKNKARDWKVQVDKLDETLEEAISLTRSEK